MLLTCDTQILVGCSPTVVSLTSLLQLKEIYVYRTRGQVMFLWDDVVYLHKLFFFFAVLVYVPAAIYRSAIMSVCI